MPHAKTDIQLVSTVLLLQYNFPLQFMVKYNHCGGFLFFYVCYFNLDENVFAISVFVIFTIIQSQTCIDSLEHNGLHRQGNMNIAVGSSFFESDSVCSSKI